MVEDVAPTLRVLIANEQQERLRVVAQIVEEAGHEVIARSVGVAAVAAIARDEEPDLAIVAAGESDEHALALVGELVEEAICPVLVLLDRSDPTFVAEAARLGVFGHLTDADAPELRSAIEVAFRRFEELRAMREAFDRRVVVERAKGVLMERHGIDQRAAFDLLRADARSRRSRVADVARELLVTLPGGPGDAR